MHTVEEIRAEYDRLDRLCGVDTSAIPVVISRRMVKRLGCFRYPRTPGGKPPQISISALLLEEDEPFWNTVRHEYAHAVVWLRHPGESHGHDAVWKSVCREVGCTPKSTAPATEDQTARRREKARYMVRCEQCGRESFYLRKGKVVELLLKGQGRRIRCTACGGNRFKLYSR